MRIHNGADTRRAGPHNGRCRVPGVSAGDGHAARGADAGERVTPSSGAGPIQTFSFQYSWPQGATAITDTWQLVHATGAAAQSCVVSFHHASLTYALWDDTGTGPPNQTSAPQRSTAVLENSQVDKMSAFSKEDLLSNYLGSMFVLYYDPKKDVGPQIEAFLNRHGAITVAELQKMLPFVYMGLPKDEADAIRQYVEREYNVR